MTITRAMDRVSRDDVDAHQLSYIAYPQFFVQPSPPMDLRLDSANLGFEHWTLANTPALQSSRDVTTRRSRRVQKKAKKHVVTVAIWNMLGSSLIALTTATLASGLGLVSITAAGVFVLGSGTAHLVAIYNLRQLANSPNS